MYILIWILDILVTWWIFYPLVIIGVLLCYNDVRSTIFDARASTYCRTYTLYPSPFITLVLTVGMLAAYKFGLFALAWQWWVVGVAAYVVAGGILSTYKWVTVILDFNNPENRAAVAKTIENARKEYFTDDRTRISDYIITRHHTLKVSKDGNLIQVYPDWNKYPLKIWWLYWPFFAFEVVIDPVQRFINRCVESLRKAYDSVARRFSVKG